MLRIYAFAAVAISCAAAAVLSPISAYGETFYGPTRLADKTYDELVINGPAALKNIKAKSLIVKGPLKFVQLDVQGSATIDGPAKGKRGAIHSLSVKGPFRGAKITVTTLDVLGPASLFFFTIKGDATIAGPLKAKKGHFNNLTAGPGLSEHTIILDDVDVEQLTIRSDKGLDALLLKGYSSVAGNVIIEANGSKTIKPGSELQVSGKGVKTTSELQAGEKSAKPDNKLQAVPPK